MGGGQGRAATQRPGGAGPRPRLLGTHRMALFGVRTTPPRPPSGREGRGGAPHKERGRVARLAGQPCAPPVPWEPGFTSRGPPLPPGLPAIQVRTHAFKELSPRSCDQQKPCRLLWERALTAGWGMGPRGSR